MFCLFSAVDIVLPFILFNLFFLKMGICENKGDKNIVYTTKSLMDKSPGASKTHLYFST